MPFLRAYRTRLISSSVTPKAAKLLALINISNVNNAYSNTYSKYSKNSIRSIFNKEEVKTELNTLYTNHLITLETTTIDRDISYDIKDSNLRILYREKLLRINTHTTIVYNIRDAVNTAPLLTSYKVRLKAAVILNTPSLKFTPNFEHIYEHIKGIRKTLHGGSSYLEEQLGGIGLSYYKDAFLNALSRDFAKDEVLVEAFQDSVCKNEICLRIVGKLNGYNCFEGVIEDGFLYIQTTAQKWGSNISYVGLHQLKELL
ncbi:hypothetical protein V8E51_011822 [Hyaloscypha variabilis]